MGIATIGGSSGLSTTDLITEPKWVLLGSNTSSSATSSVTISALSQDYRTLKIICPRIYMSTADSMMVRPNNNSSSIYSGYRTYEYTNYLSGSIHNGTSGLQLGQVANQYEVSFTITIENYSSTTDYKPMTFKWNGNSYAKEEGEILFGSNTAISSLTFTTYGGVNFMPNNSAVTGVGIFVYGGK